MPESHVLVGMAVAEDDADLFCVTSGGYGKRTPASSYPTHRRGGQGVITIKDSPDRGDLVGVTSVRNNHELMLMSQDGTVIRVSVESVRCTGRNTMGVRVMNLRGADKVSSMARLVGNGNGTDGNGGNGLDGSDHAGPLALSNGFEDTLDLEDDEYDEGEDLPEEDLAE
jgi:DNA gyrase subunit A